MSGFDTTGSNGRQEQLQGREAKTGWESRIPTLSLIIGLVLGLLYVFVLPPMQAPDEMMHFARIYSVSQGVCLPSPDIDMPKSFEQLHETFPAWLETHRLISVDDLKQSFYVQLNEKDLAGNGRKRSLEGFINQNQISCIPYLPSAVAMYAGLKTGLPPIGIMYWCRFTNLAFFLAAVFLSMRLLPCFRSILFCIALMPMTLHQAASASADSFTFSAGFVFTAYVIFLAYHRETTPLRFHHFVVLTLLLLAVVLSKAMIFMAILLLLIPADKFINRKKRWTSIISCFVIALAVAAAWQQANKPNFQRQVEERLSRGAKGLPAIDLSANTRFMAEHPVELAAIFVRSTVDLEYAYATLKDMVGTLGWLSVELPDWLIWLYAGALLAAALARSGQSMVTNSARAIISLFVIAGVVYALVYGWVFETPKFVLDSLGEWQHIRVYVQGRYLIPVLFPLLMIFSNSKIRVDYRCFTWGATAVILIANFIAIYAVRYTYYL